MRILPTWALVILTVIIVGTWAVLAPSWWSLISAVVVLVAIFFGMVFADYLEIRGPETHPMPAAAKWFVILLLLHSTIGLAVAIYKYAV
jgi:hypothetical protein